jgi:cyclic pyranopterin phosphate synthase
MRRLKVKSTVSENTGSRQPLKMVNVSGKPVVQRIAEAEGKIYLKTETIAKIRQELVEKGDVFSAATIAGILAAKNTPELIPLCHLIPLSKIDVSFSIHEEGVTAKCTVIGECRTGVEMEALVGVTTALLTIWDMVKYLEKDRKGQYPSTKITEIKVLKKKKAKTT